MTSLKIDRLEFSYEQNASTPEFSFNMRCAAREIVAITGRSGAGKSTFLNLVLGFLPPISGEVYLNGQNITNLPPAKREISALFQKNNIFEHLSVLDNITLGISPNSRPDKRQIQLALDILTKMELAGYEDRKAGDLSGGEMQRVALGRELLRDTKLMVLDEPFNGMDDETRQIILPLMLQYIAEGERAIIIVTHDLPGIENIITTHYHLAQGRFVEN